MKDLLFQDDRPIWEALLETNVLWKEGGKIESNTPHCHIEKKELVRIGKGCKIGAYTVIEGPCWIGDRVEIRPHAYIRSGSVIGDDCVIGHTSEVVRSIIFPRTRLAHFNYVGDSILGEEVNLGAGAKCANQRLDKKEIVLSISGEIFFPNRNKLGAIIGNRSSIGCDTLLNPGTVLFPNSQILSSKKEKRIVDATKKTASV